MCLIEAVYFIFHVFAECADFLFGKPLGVKVASPFKFDEKFFLIGIISKSSPQNLRNFYIENTKVVIFFFGDVNVFYIASKILKVIQSFLSLPCMKRYDL